MTIKYKGKPITKELVRTALKDDTIWGDGHSILSPEGYHPHFDVSHLEETIKSDFSSGKSTIYVNGRPVKEIKGVNNLTFLYWLANEIGLSSEDYGSYNGRGTQARSIVGAIARWAEQDQPDGEDH